MAPGTAAPRHVVVVGAGMAGLSVAWFLQDQGVEVTVLDRSGVAAGSSWGNAGWLTPGLAIPLAEPAVLRHGLTALRDPAAPLHIPMTADPALWSFLARFATRCTPPVWRRTMAALVPVNRQALAAYDLIDPALPADVRSRARPIMAAFTEPQHADALLHELAMVRSAGQEVTAEDIGASALRALAPTLSPRVQRAIRIDGQRTLDPGRYLGALAHAVRDRGGEVRGGAEVRRLRHGPGGIAVDVLGGHPVTADAVVLASGAWLPELARSFGVRVPLRAGRGYSFALDQPAGAAVEVPVYFPHQRVVASPLGDRLRLGGTMEFRSPDAALDPARIDAIVAAARPLFQGLDLDLRRDEWVGSRPITVDGLPLVGPTRARGVWVHGGHGMWGMCHGPATARLLVQRLVTGVAAPELAALDPLR
jgi:D-amino-acid dehydrogenase